MRDFERTKQSISGRSIMITSWFDPDSDSWHASAPDYICMLREAMPKLAVASTRDQAVGILSTHLSGLLDKR